MKFLIDINEDIIRKRSNKASYKSGREYYLNNKVKDIDIEIDERDDYTQTDINSIVESSNLTLYKVDVSFDNVDFFMNYSCDCSNKLY